MNNPNPSRKQPLTIHPQIAAIVPGTTVRVHMPNGDLYTGTLVHITAGQLVLDAGDRRTFIPITSIGTLTFPSEIPTKKDAP